MLPDLSRCRGIRLSGCSENSHSMSIANVSQRKRLHCGSYTCAGNNQNKLDNFFPKDNKHTHFALALQLLLLSNVFFLFVVLLSLFPSDANAVNECWRCEMYQRRPTYADIRLFGINTQFRVTPKVTHSFSTPCRHHHHVQIIQAYLLSDAVDEVKKKIIIISFIWHLMRKVRDQLIAQLYALRRQN